MSPTQYAPDQSVFDYDDVMLVPGECIVKSRSEVDVSTTLGGRKWKLPVIPANMSSVLDEETAGYLADNGYFYVMHRFNVDAIQFVRKMQASGRIASISVGIQPADFDLITRMRKEEQLTPDYITIDIAHGDTQSVRDMIVHIRHNFGDRTYIIAGNVGTAEGALRLVEAGASAVKAGIGPGSACLTSPNTGFGTRGWQLSAVALIAEALKDTTAQVIADGGIRSHGDIAKSIAFGADFVMVGGMFAGHDESPGKTVEVDGETFKKFYGSASAEQKGNSTHVEGKSMLVPYRGPLINTLEALEQNLKSSVSYAGGKHLHDLINAQYVFVR